MIFKCCCITVDSACNAAGLGFSGYDKLGYAQWDLVSAVDIFAVEASGLYCQLRSVKLICLLRSLAQMLEQE